MPGYTVSLPEILMAKARNIAETENNSETVRIALKLMVYLATVQDVEKLINDAEDFYDGRLHRATQ